MSDKIAIDDEKSVVVCPQCKKKFNLIWDADYGEKSTLIIRSCPSGGVYDVKVSCPHCDYEEPL